MRRSNYQSKSPFEPLRGYSRAVKVGDHLYISGTTATLDSGEVVGVGDHFAQTEFVIDKIRKILTATGYNLQDVVRTRLFVTDLKNWAQYARAHRMAFEKVRPASSIVEVSALVDPRLLIEMEVDAIKGCQIEETIDL